MISIFYIFLLALIQGMAELLPVSSSAHVIVTEKLLGIDPTTPEMTFLLVMLHTGTMVAVLFYFWRRWQTLWTKAWFFSLAVATVLTGIVGFGLKKVIEKVFLSGPDAEIEQIFGNLSLIAISLLAAGILILIAGRKKENPAQASSHQAGVDQKSAAIIGVVQGLCLPFRGFSRSGATISSGMLLGIPKNLAEDFSFALAVILTPPVVLRELMRLIKSHELHSVTTSGMLVPGLIGMLLSFGSGLLALRWLSSWIDHGRWSWFGYYCILASLFVFGLGHFGYQ